MSKYVPVASLTEEERLERNRKSAIRNRRSYYKRQGRPDPYHGFFEKVRAYDRLKKHMDDLEAYGANNLSCVSCGIPVSLICGFCKEDLPDD